MEEQSGKDKISNPQSWQIFEELDTTRFSLLHSVFRQSGISGGLSFLSIVPIVYLSFLIGTLLPLFVSAFLDLPTLTQHSKDLKLPFLYDWNVHFMFAFSLPMIAVYTITDHHLLASAGVKIIRENIINISSVDAKLFVDSWNKRFAKINIWVQIAGVAVGAIIAYSNYKVFSNYKIGYWILKNGQFSVTGWIYIYCIFLFYSIVTVYVLRTIIFSIFLRDLAKRVQMLVVPFHPDQCGGLRPVGVLGLRNQYILSVLGINILILIFVYFKSLEIPLGLFLLIVLAAIAYIILSPIVFVLPMLPFRIGMIRNKDELINDVAKRLRLELDRVRVKLQSGPVSKEDEEIIERLRKISQMTGDMAVWPFDSQTLRKFVTAYMVPLVTSVGIPLFKKISGIFHSWL